MADDKQSGSGLGGSVILLVAAAASAVYVGWRSPLVSTRPTASDYEIAQIMPAQDIEARLWQDPFGAVERAIEVKRNGKVDPTAGRCLEDFRKLLSQSNEPTLLVGVSLPGDPYPEADETRRRLRYAMLSALHVAQYTPVDERHIGYFLTNQKPTPSDNPKLETVASGFFRVVGAGAADPPAEGIFGVNVSEPAANCVVKAEGTGDNKLSIPDIVPYERYEALHGHKRIFVLWLDEEALAHGPNPIASLTSLWHELDISNKGDLHFAFAGPQDSNLLQVMVKETLTKISTEKCKIESLPMAVGDVTSAAAIPITSQPSAHTEQQPHRPVADGELLPIYNFGATAQDQIILSNAGVDDPQKTSIRCLFRHVGVSYYRTISSDEALAEVLAQELYRRGIDLCPEKEPLDPRAPGDSRCRHLHHDRVFLLSEWDTAYDRYLPETVSDVFGADDSSFGDCRLKTRHGIMHASYLRGLDGRLPSRRPSKDEKLAADDGEAATPSEEINAAQPAATPETARRYETAEGQSQFDYLRRITRLLKECDDKLRLKGKGKIAAIGVLGSDVYDKLLLLQALRPEFPEAVFFTTDLDELLLPQGKLRYTRNLLVASGYGLTLTPELQRDVLPFRNTYQTSVFLATRLAIRNDERAYPESNQKHDLTIDPKTDPWAETSAAVDCWSKQPQLFQIGRTEPRGLPTRPVSGEDQACETQGKDPTADFVDYATIQPPIPLLYPRFTWKARLGTFVLPIVLLGILFCLPPIQKVFRSRLAPSDTTAQSEEPAHSSSADLRWLKPLLALTLTTLTIWALVTLAWPITAKWLTESGIFGTPIDTPDGEPMTLFEGISVWPTVAARTFGIILSLFLIWYTLRVLEINRGETMRELGIPEGKPDPTREKEVVQENFARHLLGSLHWPLDKQQRADILRRFWFSLTSSVEKSTNFARGILRSRRWPFDKQQREALLWRFWFSLTSSVEKSTNFARGILRSRRWPFDKQQREALLWRFWFPSKSSLEKPQHDRDDIDRPIFEFQKIVSPSSLKPGVRCGRAFGYTFILMVLGIFFLAPMSSSAASVPARGARAREIFEAITFVDVIVTVFLTMLVTDATIHSRWFIVRLTAIRTRWPDETRSKFKRRFGVPDSALADWLDMQYIVLKTSCITQLIYLPFLSLSLLMLTRSHLFDNFSTPWTLEVFYVLPIAVVVGSVLAYRFAAENARKVAHEHLTAKIITAQGGRKAAGQLERMLTEIESLKEGAFAPLTSQPVVKAVLLPLVTYGGALLAHFYGLPGS